MTDQYVAATIEIESEEEDWADAGKKLGEFLEASWNKMYEWSNVALNVDYIKEDDEVLLRLPGGHIELRIPGWQLEEAIRRARGGAQ